MRKTYTRARELVAPSMEVMNEQAKLMKGSLFLPIAMLIAGTLADVAEGNNCYITIGGTRNGDSFLLTLNEEGNRYYASGDSLASLSDNCRSLLVPDDAPPTPKATESQSKRRSHPDTEPDKLEQLNFA